MCKLSRKRLNKRNGKTVTLEEGKEDFEEDHMLDYHQNNPDIVPDQSSPIRGLR